MTILIVGVSTRAIAESAVRGGHRVLTLDYFGDRDQRAVVENYSLLQDFGLPCTAGGLHQAGLCLEFDSVVYLSNLENHPQVVEGLGQGRSVLGNRPEVLCQVRDWRILREFCRQEEIPCPTTLWAGEEREADHRRPWLCKPVRSGGGHGIRQWTGEPLAEGHLLQAHLKGRCASAAFVADGQRSVVLGLTEQLIGWQPLGAAGFQWCGNILPLALAPSMTAGLLAMVQEISDRLTRRFKLRGVNGIDFVLAHGEHGCPLPFLLEVNPRYTASMELVDLAYGLNVFSVHLEAMAGQLPDFSLQEHLQGPYFGKAIVFAQEAVTVPDTEGWMRPDRRDVPFPGERIEAGSPICTVLAEGEGRAACLDGLLAKAGAVRQEVMAGRAVLP